MSDRPWTRSHYALRAHFGTHMVRVLLWTSVAHLRASVPTNVRSTMSTTVSPLPQTRAQPDRPPLRVVPGARRGHSLAPSAAHPSVKGAADRQRAEHCFLEWLANPVRPDDVQLMGEDEPMPLTRLLGLVSTSRRPLSDQDAATLGLPAGTTIGDAAAELVLAVNDLGGPHWGSYRAAVYYLHVLAAAFRQL